jgi:cold shock CspA family protein
MTGLLKSLPDSGKKNFGFIKSQSEEYFFHRIDFNGHWNDLVEDHLSGIPITMRFKKVESDRGPRAADVVRVDGGNLISE